MALRIADTASIEELRAEAEGKRPFVRRPLFDRLTDLVGSYEYRVKWTPTERLALGYYLAAERRADSLKEQA